jgi:hypothetical protein
MKQKNNYFKNLFKTELNRDLFKIILVLFIYIIVIFIFKSGYDYQSVIPFRDKEEIEPVNKITYFLIVNGKDYTLDFDSRKNLLSIIESISALNVDIVKFYEGNKIKTINNSSNVLIKINGEILKDNLINNSLDQINTDTKIEITF